MSDLDPIIRAVQASVGVTVDGQAGGETWQAVHKAITGRAWTPPAPAAGGSILLPQPGEDGGLRGNAWPLERDAEEFYGSRPNLVQIEPPYPMRMFDRGRWVPIHTITCHMRVAPSLRRIFRAILSFYGTMEKLQDAGVDVYDGCYADRMVRGSATKRSMHSYGAAIDLDSEHNPLGATHGRMPAEVVAMFKAEGWRWGGDYAGRKDWMHFEACV